MGETCSRQRNSIKLKWGLLEVEDKRLFEVRGRGKWEDGRGAGKGGVTKGELRRPRFEF